MKHIRKILMLSLSAALLLASCTDDASEPWNNYSNNGGINYDGITVAQLSDKVPFTAMVYNAETANVYLVNENKTTTQIATALPVTGNSVTTNFTKAQLGLAKVGDKATLKIEAISNGSASAVIETNAITVVKTWNDVKKDDDFSILEGSTLVDTLTFSVDPGTWKANDKNVTFTATYAVGSATPQPLALVPATATSTQYSFNVKDLGVSVDSTFKIAVVASYEGLTETLEYSFTIVADKITESSNKELSVANLLSTSTAPWAKADSTKTFVGLFTGNTFTGIENAIEQDNIQDGSKEPKLYITKSGNTLTLNALPSNICKVWYANSNVAAYIANNRIAAETTAISATWTSITTNGITVTAEGYSLIKIEVEDKGNTEVYYGYLKLEEITGDLGVNTGLVTSAKYTFNYAKKRDYAKE
jgi:hypothetical protein